MRHNRQSRLLAAAVCLCVWCGAVCGVDIHYARPELTPLDAQLLECITGDLPDSGPDLARFLLAEGASPDAWSENWGMSALMLACTEIGASKETALTLIEAGADLNVRNGIGNTAFMFAARLEGFAPVLEAMASHGADPLAENIGRETALHEAARWNPDANVHQTLLRLGLSADKQNLDGETPIDVANRENPNAYAIAMLLMASRQTDTVRPTAADIPDTPARTWQELYAQLEKLAGQTPDEGMQLWPGASLSHETVPSNPPRELWFLSLRDAEIAFSKPAGSPNKPRATLRVTRQGLRAGGLVIGQSGKEDVRAALGGPQDQGAWDGGREYWIYHDPEPYTRHASVTFGPNGVIDELSIENWGPDE